MECHVQLLLMAALLHLAAPCNVRELSDIIQNRLREEVASNCGNEGDKCMFDRDCCKSLECKMVASKNGVDNICQQRETDDDQDLEQDGGDLIPPNEPSSPEDVNWMIVKSVEKDEEEGEEGKPNRDTLSEIDKFQENKKLQLLKENEELEKLFTEKDEKELEMLRVLKEEADMDELRKLKEIRIKRKLQLLKELRELRAMNANYDLDKVNDVINRSKLSQEDVATPFPKDTNYNETIAKEILEEQAQNIQETGPNEQTASPMMQKQGIHAIHHHRKHDHKHKAKKHHPSRVNTTTHEIISEPNQT